MVDLENIAKELRDRCDSIVLTKHYNNAEIFEKNMKQQCEYNIMKGVSITLDRHLDYLGEWVFFDEVKKVYSTKRHELINPNESPILFDKKVFEEWFFVHISKVISDLENWIIFRDVHQIGTLSYVISKWEVEVYESIIKLLKGYEKEN